MIERPQLWKNAVVIRVVFSSLFGRLLPSEIADSERGMPTCDSMRRALLHKCANEFGEAISLMHGFRHSSRLRYITNAH